MRRKRPERTERRRRERDVRRLVRDREKLVALEPGGSAERPLEVDSPAVVELRALSQRCPHCRGAYSLVDHQSAAAGLRVVSLKCRTCRAARQIWFRLGSSAPN
jgi:predicted Zn finger-like uncharacterized protein